MIGFIRSFECAAFGLGMAVANSGGRPATRIVRVRETNRSTIDRLIAAVTTARAERDEARRSLAALHSENARLRRELDAHRHVLGRFTEGR